jgi:anti-sigma28 factor (negative regulator of flagellin synthesis)
MPIDNVRPERAGTAGEVKRSEAAEPAVRAPRPAPKAERTDRVEISQEGRELALRRLDDAAGSLSAERIEALRMRIAAGFYDSPDVIDRVARNILDSGELGRSSGGEG